MRGEVRCVGDDDPCIGLEPPFADPLGGGTAISLGLIQLMTLVLLLEVVLLGARALLCFLGNNDAEAGLLVVFCPAACF